MSASVRSYSWLDIGTPRGMSLLGTAMGAIMKSLVRAEYFLRFLQFCKQKQLLSVVIMMMEAGRREGLSHDVSVSSVVRVTMRRQNVCRPLPSPLSSPPLLLSSPSCPHNHYWSLTATWSNNSFTSLLPLQAHPVPL